MIFYEDKNGTDFFPRISKQATKTKGMLSCLVPLMAVSLLVWQRQTNKTKLTYPYRTGLHNTRPPRMGTILILVQSPVTCNYNVTFTADLIPKGKESRPITSSAPCTLVWLSVIWLTYSSLWRYLSVYLLRTIGIIASNSALILGC